MALNGLSMRLPPLLPGSRARAIETFPARDRSILRQLHANASLHSVAPTSRSPHGGHTREEHFITILNQLIPPWTLQPMADGQGRSTITSR